MVLAKLNFWRKIGLLEKCATVGKLSAFVKVSSLITLLIEMFCLSPLPQ